MMFKVDWIDDETGLAKSEIVEFNDWIGYATIDGNPVGKEVKIKASEWAEDWAYSVSDKGCYTVTPL